MSFAATRSLPLSSRRAPSRFSATFARAALAVLTFASLAACSSSNSSSSSSSDASTDAGADDGQADAGPVAVDQDPNVYPAQHHALASAHNFGGHTLYAMKIVTVTFAGDAWRDDLRAFDDAVVAGSWWKALGHSYGVDVGTSGGYVELPDTVSGKTLDNGTDIQPLVKSAIASGALPSPDDQTLYVLYFPSAASITFNGDESCVSGMKGYHDSTNVQLASRSTDVPYVVLPRCTTNKADLTYAASHEILEGATDPFPSGSKSGWYMLDNIAFTGPGGAEIADICVFKGQVTVDGMVVSHAWSNEAAAASHEPCQPAPANEVFYGAVPETEIVTVTDSAGTHASDGFITLPAGSERDVLVVVFSDAPLPNDLTLGVGYPVAGGKLAGIASGITASLSKPTGHNGTELLLHLGAAAGMKPGDYPFVVRAALSSSARLDWPAYVRVR